MHPLRAFVFVVLPAVAFVLVSGAGLPDPMGSHFVGSGVANGSMPKAAYLALMVGLIVGIPCLIMLPAALMRHLPISLVRLPNKVYWLAPERRTATFDYMARKGAVFACGLSAFLCYVHWLVVKANSLVPAHLDSGLMLLGLGIYSVFVLVWAGGFIVHFMART